jgi:hypothetical protein
VSDEEQAYIRVNDEQNMDMLNIMIAQVFPDLIPDEYVALSYHSSVPPSGARGFAASGAAGFNYLSSQHVEPDDDPLWTMGMTLSAGDVDPRSHNFCFSALDDGRGVIALNYPFTPHIWRGKEFIHGGTVGPSTFDHKDPALGLGVYQKTRLQSFSQRDASLFPSSFEMPIGRSARFKPGALRWVI